MPDAVVFPFLESVYSTAWKILEDRIAKSRRQSISKADLVEWQLKALEQAIDRSHLEAIYANIEKQHGKQKEA